MLTDRLSEAEVVKLQDDAVNPSVLSDELWHFTG